MVQLKSITIHGMDDQVYFLVKQKAQELGFSLNKTLKSLISSSLGIQKQTTDHRKDFLEFYNCWNEQDETEFADSVKDFEAINTEDWK